MSYGIKISGDGWIYDTTGLSWMLIDDSRTVYSNRSATFSYPQLAGYGMEAKVLEIPRYNPFNVSIGAGFWYVVEHNISVSYTGGYPTISMSVGVSKNAFSQTVNIPMHVYVFVR